jgi:glycerophosphoryl diester phosphodiesterase
MSCWWHRCTALRIGAHRGDLATAAENTFAAFEAAATAGADYIETDVQRTSDGVLVLLHDDTLERTTGRVSPIADITSAQLLQLDAAAFLPHPHAVQPIPLLTQFLEWLAKPGRPAGMLEAKAKGSGHDIAKLLQHAPQELRSKVAICSFHTEELLSAKHVDPRLPCFLIWPRSSTPADLLATARELGIDGVNVAWQYLTPGIVADLHAAGLLVTGGTANDETTIVQLVHLHVDFVDSDYPREAVNARNAAIRPTTHDRKSGPRAFPYTSSHAPTTTLT